MPQTIEFESWPQIASQYCTVLVAGSTTPIESAVLAVAVANNAGLFRVTFSGAAGAVTGKHDLLVKDSDGNLLVRYQVELTGSGTSYAKERGEVRLGEELAGLDLNPEITVQMAPWYAQVRNATQEVNFSLEKGEIKRTSIAVLDGNGQAVNLSGLGYDEFEIIITTESGTVLQTVADADITVTSNVFSFVNNSAVTQNKGTYPYKLWGNGGESPSIHAKVVEGRISVS